MRPKERIERILNLIKELWESHQDYRFGQLLINYQIVNDDLRLWNNEDDGFEKYLKQILENEKRTKNKI